VPPRYRHVVWDWNGTLLDDAWLCVESINWLLDRHGLPTLTAERYRQVFDFPVRDYYERAGFDLERYSFEELGTAFMDEYQRRLPECRLRRSAREVLEALAAAKVGQSILSAYRQQWLEDLVARHSLAHLFGGLHGADDHYAHGKLDRAMTFVADLPCSPGDVVMVGDTTHDHAVARAMGVDCILLDGGNQTVERLRSCGVPVVADLSSVLDLVLGRGPGGGD